MQGGSRTSKEEYGGVVKERSKGKRGKMRRERKKKERKKNKEDIWE